MENQKQQGAIKFAAAFAASLSKSLTEAAGAPQQLKVLENADLTTPHGQQMHFRLTAEGSLQGVCFIEFFESQVAELAAKILGNPPAPFEDAHAEALAKALSSSLTALSATAAADYGAFSFKVERVTNPVFDRTHVVVLASNGTEPELRALLFLDPKVIDALAARDALHGKRAIDSGNLDLVMDVELNVALRFGQRQLPLREVLDLSSGSVVELDCQVDEPIELLLDGKVIARGEAVIVDGNYGLRVTEIPQPIASHLSR
jgi:flagellar motor switch protein FliN/FliY